MEPIEPRGTPSDQHLPDSGKDSVSSKAEKTIHVGFNIARVLEHPRLSIILTSCKENIMHPSMQKYTNQELRVKFMLNTDPATSAQHVAENIAKV